MALTEAEGRLLEDNLFELVRPLVHERPGFPWHRDQDKRLTTCRLESSQALAVDVLGTIERLSSRDDILNAVSRTWNLPQSTNWAMCLERILPLSLLNERRPTQLDGTAEGYRSLLVFEGKFTESDGGSCSQPSRIVKGANAGKVRCNGRYEIQTNEVTGQEGRCALTGKGIRYWSWVPRVLDLDPTADYQPCPFRGGWYQWMRNLVAAAALAENTGRQPAFIVLYADGPFPMAKKLETEEWKKLRAHVAGKEVALREMSYQALIAIAQASASPADAAVLQALSAWVKRKIEQVAAAA